MPEPACRGRQLQQSEEPPVKCKVIERRDVAANDATPLGTPREVAEGLEATYSAPLRWSDRSEPSDEGTQPEGSSSGSSSSNTELEFRVTPDLTQSSFIDRELEPGACSSTLEMEAVASFVTEDGAFAEELHGTLTYGTLTYDGSLGFWFVAELPVSDFQGTYDVSGIADQYGDPYYTFRTRLSPLEGNCFMDGTDRDSDPNTVLGSAAIASWGE